MAIRDSRYLSQGAIHYLLTEYGPLTAYQVGEMAGCRMGTRVLRARGSLAMMVLKGALKKNQYRKGSGRLPTYEVKS